MAATLDDILKGIQGLGTADSSAKASSKAAKQLAELQGKIQKQLAKQQAEYAQALEAQRAAASLQQQREQQAFQKPFTEAELTGLYNGTKTLAMIQEERNAREFREQQQQQESQFGRQLEQSGTQFNKTLEQNQREFQMENELEQNKLNLQAEIQRRTLTLQELETAQKDAIARGELALSEEIQRRKTALEEQNQRDQVALETAQTSGYMQNGQLTEAARAARAQEALARAEALGVYVDPQTGLAVGETQAAKQFNAEMALKEAQTMGVNAQGQMTDAAQQWRTQSGLEYARVAAQLAANPADYFESAAFMRNASVQDPMNFLNEINRANAGSNAGFRSYGQGLPGANSIQRIAQGQPAPSTGMYNMFASAQESMPQDEMVGIGLAERGADLNGADMGSYRGMVQSGMKPPTATQEGPSASVAQAQAANQGQNVAFTKSMNQPMPSLGQAFQAQQANYDPAAQRLQAFAPVFQAGAHRMGPGAMEAMSPTEKALFQSAARASGINPEDWDQSYKRSRLQTEVSANRV